MATSRIFFIVFCYVLLLGCSSSPKEEDRKSVIENKEFDKVIAIKKIKEPVPKPEAVAKKTKSSKPKNPTLSAGKKKVKSRKKEDVKAKSGVAPKPESSSKMKSSAKVKPKLKKHLPAIEDAEGFDGRRPVVEPYRVGEEVVLGISYFGVEAGKFKMQVLPMVSVNGKKSYHFRYVIKSSPLFSMFYSVDDIAETFVDYETLVPYSYEIHVKESKQIRETKTFFDHKKLKATMWDNKKKPDEPVEKKKIEWDLKAYSQNVFSAAYYLRNFTLKVGKELKVHVGHEGSNILMKAKVVRKEKIYTDAGAFETFVVKPSFDVEGKFKPTGENFLWLTADDKKWIVRLESKIKIGTIVGEVQKIKK